MNALTAAHYPSPLGLPGAWFTRMVLLACGFLLSSQWLHASHSYRISGPLPVGGGVPSFGFQISPDGNRLVYRADQLTDGVNELFNPRGPENYAAFAAFHTLTTPPDGDQDGDRLPNVMEYALALNPRSPDFGAPGLPSFIKSGASDVFSFNMPAISPPDIELKIQSSTDLNGWAAPATRAGGGAWTGTLLPVVTTPAPGLTTVTLTRPDGGAVKRYYRLSARLLP